MPRLIARWAAAALAAAAAAWADPAPGLLDQPDDGRDRLALVENGYDALLLRVHLIRQARTSVDIQTFIWTKDECGALMMAELLAAAQRGVRVRIIADQMVSEKDPATVAGIAVAHPNLLVKHYRPPLSRINPGWWHTLWAGLTGFGDFNQRMHNKVMIVDGRVLITGGRNVENTYFDHSTVLDFRDRDVLAAGPAARSAAASFEQYWAFRDAVPSRQLKDVQAVLARGGQKRYAARADFDFGPFFGELTRQADDPAEIRRRFTDRLRPVRRATFVADEPGKRRVGASGHYTLITKALNEALDQARSNIVMQTPYLVLSKPARELFAQLRRRPGLRIRISSNSFASTDNIMAYSGNYRLRGVCIEQLGLEVHELKPRPADLLRHVPQFPLLEQLAAERRRAGLQEGLPFLSLHAKSLVVDDRLAFVGSYNLDPRSELLNTEAGLLVDDEAFAAELRGCIERDLRPENSWVIARRALPLGLDAVNGVVDGVLSLSPLDLWPIQNTSSYELKPGAAEVPPGDPAFHAHYDEAGSFPGADGALSQKEIITRLYKVIGAPLTPIL